MTHECQECGDTFDTETGLKIHQGKSHSRPYHDREKLRSLYHDEGLSQTEIAEKYNVQQNLIKKWMKKHGIDARKSCGDSTRPVYHSFLERPERPVGTCEERIETRASGQRVTVKIHRLVAYAIGEITFEEFCDQDVKVHHQSGHGYDNRPKNLEKVTQSEHRERHAGTPYRR